MNITLTRPMIDNEDHLIHLYEGIEKTQGKRIKEIKQKGLNMTILFEK